MRAYLEARDGRGCGRCGDPIEPGETPSIGHVIALAHGGSDVAANLRLEHLACNRDAGADGDRARIVEPVRIGDNVHSIDAWRAVFQRTPRLLGTTRRPWNGARSEANNRTIVRFRLTAPDPARGPRNGDAA
jgi:hypothetical protein